MKNRLVVVGAVVMACVGCGGSGGERTAGGALEASVDTTPEPTPPTAPPTSNDPTGEPTRTTHKIDPQPTGGPPTAAPVTTSKPQTTPAATTPVATVAVTTARPGSVTTTPAATVTATTTRTATVSTTVAPSAQPNQATTTAAPRTPTTRASTTPSSLPSTTTSPLSATTPAAVHGLLLTTFERAEFTVVLGGCAPGEEVQFSTVDSQATAVCAPGAPSRAAGFAQPSPSLDGTAIGTLVAPDRPGIIDIEARGMTSGTVATIQALVLPRLPGTL